VAAARRIADFLGVAFEWFPVPSPMMEEFDSMKKRISEGMAMAAEKSKIKEKP